MAFNPKRAAKDPLYIPWCLLHKVSRLLKDDKQYLKLDFLLGMHRRLNLESPKTFCEKMQWLKLYNRKPQHSLMVDKYEAKKYVSAIIGDEYIVKSLGVWEHFDDIDFGKLPDQFVLKCTHDSGGLVICRDKAKFDKDFARSKIEACLKQSFYWEHREFPYKNVKPRIIVEQYLENRGKVDLVDYKIYCFNGKAKYCQVIQDRSNKETIDFFDEQWVHQKFCGLNPLAEHSSESIIKPHNWELMKELASRLSADEPFLRVDFYEIDDKVYFGELTFFPSGGLGVFTPKEWDLKLGEMIKLPL